MFYKKILECFGYAEGRAQYIAARRQGLLHEQLALGYVYYGAQDCGSAWVQCQAIHKTCHLPPPSEMNSALD